MTLSFLKLKYPTLSSFFQSCFDRGEFDKLWDFMLAIETDENMRDN